jgi:phthiodiolone/phenolphthiodiolone dimycocerosates ketoreductase
MLDITSRYADGWLPAWKMTPDEYGQKIEVITVLARQYKRKVPKLGMLADVVLGNSREEIIEVLRKNPREMFLAAFRAPAEIWRKWGLNHPFGSDAKGLPDVILADIPVHILHESLKQLPAEFIGDIAFVGSQDEVLSELWEYRKRGMTHLALIAPFDAVDQMELEGGAASNFSKLCSEIKRW